MADQKPLTIERLFASPSLSGPSPTGVKYSPDGKRVTFLQAREDEANRYDLWQFDVGTGAGSLLVDSQLLEPEEVELSEEEKALRERKRIAGRKGIVSYDWGTSDTILVPLGGDLHLVTLGEDGTKARQLTDTDAFEYDAKVSPSGKYVSFVRDGAVYAIDLATGTESRLTPLAQPDKAISYGVAEFVAQEEMSRYTGYWWSPDDRYVAYTKVDESTVDIIPRFDIAAEDVTVIEQRYPRAGRPNALVDLFIHEVGTNRSVSLSSFGPDTYLADAQWTSAERFLVRDSNRDQTELGSILFDPGGATYAVDDMVERQDRWFNISHDGVRTAKNESGTGHFIFSSERSGMRHVWSINGLDLLQQVTKGDWPIDAIVGLKDSVIYFTGYKDTPLERHLYSVPLEGGEPTRITELKPGFTA